MNKTKIHENHLVQQRKDKNKVRPSSYTLFDQMHLKKTEFPTEMKH